MKEAYHAVAVVYVGNCARKAEGVAEDLRRLGGGRVSVQDLVQLTRNHFYPAARPNKR